MVKFQQLRLGWPTTVGFQQLRINGEIRTDGYHQTWEEVVDGR